MHTGGVITVDLQTITTVLTGLGVLIALAALMMTMKRDLKASIDKVETGLSERIDKLETKTEANFAQLRTEHRSDMNEIRTIQRAFEDRVLDFVLPRSTGTDK